MMPRPEHVRHCKTCGDEMIWLPMKNVFGVLYRWRAWCRSCGFATRQT